MEREVLIYFTCDDGTTMHTKQRCGNGEGKVLGVVKECAEAIRLLFAGEVTKVEVYGKEGLIQTF